MKSGYWSSVGKRLLSLGKTAVNLAAPVAVDFAVSKAVEKTCSVIEEKLKKVYKRTAINSAISFTINLCGVLILVFKPFGEKISRIVTYVLFFASFVFWLVRMILFIKKNGKTTFAVLKKIIQEKSVYKGIEKYVLTNFPLISLGYAGVDFAAEYLPFLKDVPRISEFVARLVKIFWKRVALFAGIMATYTVLVFWVIKPILVRQFF